jgi:hypothetical protein
MRFDLNLTTLPAANYFEAYHLNLWAIAVYLNRASSTGNQLDVRCRAGLLLLLLPPLV